MMKKILLISLVLVFFFQISFASTDTVKFAVIRLDYLAYSLKDIYFSQQPYQISIPAEHEQIYHSLYVRFIPASELGGTTIRSANMDMVIYEATTAWYGTGAHIFPTSEFETDKPDTIIKPHPEFIDFEASFFFKGDSVRVNIAWQTASNLAHLQIRINITDSQNNLTNEISNNKAHFVKNFQPSMILLKYWS